MDGSVASRPVEVVAEGFHFLEGPRWHDGTLYVSDFFAEHVLRVGTDGQVEVVCDVPGMPSGLGWDPDGNLLVVSMEEKRLLRFENGSLSEVADLGALAGGILNDMVVNSDGRAYIGNFGGAVDRDRPHDPLPPTRLIRVDPDGSAEAVGEELRFPNGTVITPDGRTLVVAETFVGQMSAFDLGADGSLGQRRIWAEFDPPPEPTAGAAVAAGTVSPDGICLDAEGCIWIADAAGRGAHRVREGGEILETVSSGGELSVFACALGGEDRRTLYMCAAPPLFFDHSTEPLGKLLAARVDVPGAGLP